MDQHELAEELLDGYISDGGDNDSAWNNAWDEAGEIIRCANADQDAQESFNRDLYDSIGRDNAIRSPNSPPHRPTPNAARRVVGNVAINVGSHIGVRIIDALWDKLFSKEEATPPTPVEEAPSVNDRLDRLEADIDEIRQNQGQMQEALNSLSLPKVA